MLASIALLGLAVAALPRAGFAQSDPFIGRWQLNLAKSKFSPGPGPKSATMNVQGEGENHNVTFAGINAEGNRQSLVLTWLYDGMPHPVTPNTEANRLGLLGNPNIDARTTIPIVFVTGADPVALGLVASLNRPGGNLTGTSIISVEMISKRLELLHELLPTAKSVALLVNPSNAAATEAETKEMRIGTSALGLRLVVLNASTPNEIEAAFATAFLEHAGALVVSTDALFNIQRDQLLSLAARHAVPAIYPYREQTAAGGLMSYGPDLPDIFRLLGVYAGRILKGEKPADMPVQQPTKFELVINLKTGKALGLTIPETLLATADEVIQ
jgi:putative tryptophan/tyrosine transport system substrate-binding protein